MNGSFSDKSLFFAKLIIFFILASTHSAECRRKMFLSKNQVQIFRLYIIVDFHLYRQLQNDTLSIERRIQSIFILINKAFYPVKIQFQIVHIEIWISDVISQMSEEEMIEELKDYKQKSTSIYHDCLHAFIGSRHPFTTHGYGELLSMCSRSSCVGYTLDSFKNDIKDTAFTVSHELAHNFGIRHDTSDCKCSNCIMATGIEISSRTLSWSACSLSEFRSLLIFGYPSCKPHDEIINPIHLAEVNYYRAKRKIKSRYSSINIAICGNGIVEPGEDCDCGQTFKCDRCCNRITCKLSMNAQCASGPCCHRPSCQIMSSGTVCRPAREFCDLPEFCNGIDETCPANVYRHDGSECQTNFWEKAYCFEGKCKSHLTQCRFLWGQTSNISDISCYRENIIKNDMFRNCGTVSDKMKIFNTKYFMKIPTKECTNNNYLCGRLWCTHRNERIMQFGFSETTSFVNSQLNFCEGARFELDWRNRDLGLVPNGALCGNNSLCLNTECVDVSTIFDEACHCNGNGICDNHKICHCYNGYPPPNCKERSPKTSTSLFNESGRASVGSSITYPYSGSKYSYRNQLLKLGFISISAVLFAAVIFIFLQKWKLKRWKRFYIYHLKNQSSSFIREISSKTSFLQSQYTTTPRKCVSKDRLKYLRVQINKFGLKSTKV